MPNSTANISIGIFADVLQGPFTGEIANQIRQLCLLSGHTSIFFSCLGKDYSSDFDIENLDAAILIRDCLSVEMAAKLLERGIATVSISQDYYPLEITVISADNAKGTELGFNFLQQKGHKQIAFVGDFKHFDIRNRFDRFSQLLEQHQMPSDPKYLIQTSSIDIGGGMEAASIFKDRRLEVGALFFAAGYLAAGFLAHLRADQNFNSEHVDIVAFDSFPLLGTICPEVNVIDQNTHIVAYRAVSEVKNILKGETEHKRSILIDPKLIAANNDAMSAESPFLATSVDLPEIYNPTYASALINHNYLWLTETLDSSLSNLLSLSPIFEKFLAMAVLRKFGTDNTPGEEEYFTINKGLDSTLCNANSQNNSDECKRLEGSEKDYACVCHFMIYEAEGLWGCLSTYGPVENTQQPSSFLYFCGLMSNIAKNFGLEKALASARSRIGKSEASEGAASADSPSDTADNDTSIVWDVHNNLFEWSDGALALLGLCNEMDKVIYRQMDIIDRMARQEVTSTHESLEKCASEGVAFTLFISLKNKSGQFKSFQLAGSVSESSTAEHTELKMVLSDFGSGSPP